MAIDSDIQKQGDAQAQIQRVRRVADANRKRLYLFAVRPQSPRGVQFNSNGYLAWDEPQEKRNVTHYNVYAGDDATLYRRYPVGTTTMNDLTPDQTLIWVSAFNEESGLESPKAQAATATPAGIPDAYVPPPPAGPASNVTGFTAGNARINADQGGEMVRLNGAWTLPATNYTGARIIGQASGDTGWTILATTSAADTSFNGPWMPAPSADKVWTLKVQPINADGAMSPLDGGTPTSTTTITKGVAGYDLSKVLAGSYDSVTFGVDGFGHFYVKGVDLTKAWNLNVNEFDVTGGFHINKLSADKVNAGTLKVGGYVGGGSVAGQILIVDNDNSTMLGWIGKSSDNAYRGAWFPLLRVGGSDPSGAFLVATNNDPTTHVPSLTLKGASLYVGPGTKGLNGQFWVYNSLSVVGWIGSDDPASPTYYGGWFKQLYVGGSGPGDAQIVCDSFGNAVFKGTLAASVIAALTLNVSQINAGWSGGTVVVGSGGFTFSGTGGVQISGSGNVQVLAGYLYAGSYIRVASGLIPTTGGFQVGSTIVIDQTCVANFVSLKIYGTEIIDSSGNGKFAGIYRGGVEIGSVFAAKGTYTVYSGGTPIGTVTL